FFDQVADLDWDSAFQAYIPQVLETKTVYEYYRTLERFVALLGDGHTDIVYPKYMWDSLTFPPLSLDEAGGRAYVINVAKSLAERIPIGSQITAVDGVEYHTYLERSVFPNICESAPHTRLNRAVRWSLRGWVNTTCAISYTTPGGEPRSETLTRHRAGVEWLLPRMAYERLVEFRWLDSGIAYVALNSFNEDSTVIQFEELAPELYAARGVILDVRQNNGGNSNRAAAILSHFTTDTLYGSKWKTREHVAAYKAWAQYSDEYAPYLTGDVWYEESDWKYEPTPGTKISAPVVILIGVKTRSAAEDFLVFADPLPQFTFVGEPSSGSTGQPLNVALPGGGRCGIVSKRDQFPDGRDFVGVGVQPDIFVPRTRESLLGESDPALQQALETLLETIGR
ncbi:MAG TPA: S41 family peptidase, partial [candidate division Zixibacteria bacterium]|nr:S41 family peptidase [candidate division Zixibacteria bacterium]